MTGAGLRIRMRQAQLESMAAALAGTFPADDAPLARALLGLLAAVSRRAQGALSHPCEAAAQGRTAGDSYRVAPRGLESDSAELAHPDPGQDPGDGEERHVEQLGDQRR